MDAGTNQRVDDRGVKIHGRFSGAVHLKGRFGAQFEQLAYVECVPLALAFSEGSVNHARLRAVTTDQPVDLSKTLQHLTQAGILKSTGGWGAVYHLRGKAIPTPDDVFGPTARSPALSFPNTGSSSLLLGSSSPNLALSSPNLAGTRNADGCLLADQLSRPVIDDLGRLSPRLRASLEAMASEPRAKGKVDRDVLIGVIVALCEGRFVTLRCLAEPVNRKPDTLREQYLSKLVRDRKLSLAFPTTPTHERQAYCTTSSLPP